MATADGELQHYCIKEPSPDIFQAWEFLSRAVDAHLSGTYAEADRLFRRANMPEVYDWGYSAWNRPDQNVTVQNPDGDTRVLPMDRRHSLRQPTGKVKAAVLARDGYRCRYCGMPVVDADIRKIAHALYPEAVPWHPTVFCEQHAAFQCFWLQYDHVVPHSHGGSSSEENIVVCCHLCNFGKDRYTLRQLGLSDPRLRPPSPVPWDGLERLRAHDRRPRRMRAPRVTVTTKAISAFFLPGARIEGNYLVSPPIAGTSRWFKLDSDAIAEAATRKGVDGYRLICDPAQLRRRGLSPEHLLDTE